MTLSKRSDPQNGINKDTSSARPSPPKYTPVTPKDLNRPLSSTHGFFQKKSGAQKHRFIDSTEFKQYVEKARATPESNKTFHLVFKYMKKGVTWFFKINPDNSLMSELESAAWGIFDLIAPGYVPPKTRAYYDSRGVYVGVCSQEIPNFKSFRHAPLTEKDLENKELVGGMAIGSTISFLLAEEDNHIDNGNKAGQRIDLDMLCWPILGQYKDVDTLCWIYRPPKEERYSMIDEDIRHFPDLQGGGSKPFYWLTARPNGLAPSIGSLPVEAVARNAFSISQNETFKKLKVDPIFIYEKFKTQLKFLLLSDEQYSTRIKQHIRPEVRDVRTHKKMTDVLTDWVSKRKTKLRDVLVGMFEFHDFLTDKGEIALNQILDEINLHNKIVQEREVHKRAKNPSRSIDFEIDNLIDPEEIRANYRKIFNEVVAEACKSVLTP
jgi:hypothetical protein